MSTISDNRKWTVYTPGGIYHITAPSANAAKRAVYYLTFGRIREADMTAERTA